MANLVSSWSKSAKAVPQEYVYLPNLRPQLDAPICKEIPVVDLSLAMASDVDQRNKLIHQILRALDEFGVFQVINHGLPEKLMEDAMEIYKEFFNLPIEEKEKYVTNGITNSRKTFVYNGGENSKELIHFWRDTLVHYCHPLEQHIDSWPKKPDRYREVIAEYVMGTRKLSQKIFELIAEGIGLQKDYFTGKLLEIQNLRANYYPKCPDPSLTTGVSVHHDPNMTTLIQQNHPGLQIHKDGKWLVVEPLPNAFFVTTGLELEIISNGRFKARLHQVATNAEADRLSIGMFISANEKIPREPSKEFVSDGNPPKYKDYTFEKYSQVQSRKLLEDLELSGVAICEAALDFFRVEE